MNIYMLRALSSTQNHNMTPGPDSSCFLQSFMLPGSPVLLNRDDQARLQALTPVPLTSMMERAWDFIIMEGSQG